MCLRSWPIIIIIWVHPLLFYITSHFSIRLWYGTGSVLYTTISDNYFTGWTENLQSRAFTSQTCTQKRSWSLVVCSGLTQYSFFNPGETTASEKCVQRTNEVHPKLQYLGYHTDRQKGSNSLHLITHQTILPKPKSTELWSSALSSMFLPTDYHSFRNLTNFLQGNTP